MASICNVPLMTVCGRGSLYCKESSVSWMLGYEWERMQKGIFAALKIQVNQLGA